MLSEWPPTPEEAKVWLPLRETALIEFKREWHDLNSRRGKAEFIKDVLALANAARPDDPAYLVIGVEDIKEGRDITGVEDSPDVEQLHQILAAYANPVPEVDYATVTVDDHQIAILRIRWTDAQPYYAIRDYDGVLDSRLVYARRGPTVGFLRPAEVEALFRSKGLAADPSNHPIQAGFVEDGQEFGRLTLRIVNITEEPLVGVTVLWDLEQAERTFFRRVRSYSNLRLRPGEAYEDEFEPGTLGVGPGNGNSADNEDPSSGWLNVTAYIQYRDRAGFIRQVERRIAVQIG